VQDLVIQPVYLLAVLLNVLVAPHTDPNGSMVLDNLEKDTKSYRKLARFARIINRIWAMACLTTVARERCPC
jgi:hypothetical protein